MNVRVSVLYVSHSNELCPYVVSLGPIQHNRIIQS